MLPHLLFFIAPFLLGLSGGLRALTPFAVFLIALRFDFVSLGGTWLEFLSSTFILVAAIFLAVGELIGDKLSFAPNRTAWLGLSGRIFSGALCGAMLIASQSGNSFAGIGAGAVLGIIGALIGTFAGFYSRTQLTRATGAKDIYIAIPEDILAISIAVLTVYLSI